MTSTVIPSPSSSALPRIVTVGRHRIGRVLERLAHVLADQVQVEHISASFDDAVTAIQALQTQAPIDAIVVAGASGNWVRERVDVPCVPIEVRGLDLLQSLAHAGALAAARVPPSVPPRVGLVSFDQPSPHLAQFDARFGVGIAQYTYRGPEDADACVQALLADGIHAVVAPGLVADLAEAAGIASVLLYSDGAVLQALRDAALTARHRQAERNRHERLESVLNQLQDGVVAVDRSGVVQALNPTMAAMLGSQPARLHGQVLDHLAPALSVGPTLQFAHSSEDVVQLGLRTLAVRRAPLWDNGQVSGALLVCRDAAVIERADRSLRASQRQRSSAARWRIEDSVGQSEPMQRLRELALLYAQSDATVLIQGESGTGKELLAQGLHCASRRAAQPFVAVNCAALSESLLESELFGYDEGAFTGARRGGKLGLLESAHTGTLFLDEIGDMPLALQSRLLRVLQEREVLRVGATTPVPVDVRFIAATHTDLADAVARGSFRSDLYYRLAVLPLRTPPLRERGAADVTALAHALWARRTGSAGHDALLQAALDQASGHLWPGNVRELENYLDRLMACRCVIASLPPQGRATWLRALWSQDSDAAPAAGLPAPMQPESAAAMGDDGAAPHSLNLRQARMQAERAQVQAVLEQVGGNQREACALLGISRATLWRRLNSPAKAAAAGSGGR